jgi:DNA-binding NtrC family response regulator/tetratricopeptide (TPR) repeat protein
LQRCTVVNRGGVVKLVADRFVVRDDERAVDLSSGEEIMLVASAAGGPSEQARWTLRCDRWSRLYHPAIARLVDYGIVGEMRRFEAWRCGPPWQGGRAAAAQAIGQAAAFLRANALTEGTLSMQAVRRRGDRAVVVPSVDMGYDAEPAMPPVDLTLAACGLAIANRRAADAVAELFTHLGPWRARAVALWAPPGGGLGTSIEDLARTARLNGYVPLSSRLVESEVLGLLAGRSLFLIDRAGAAGAWRRVVDITLRAPGPHVLLLAGREEIAHVHGLPLEPLPASVLVEAIRPRNVPVAIRRRVEAAASRSRGLPGKFVSLLWGNEVSRKSQGSSFKSQAGRQGREAIVQAGVFGVTGRVAERSPAYGVGGSTAPEVTEPARSPSWAASGELAVLRRRLEGAIRQLDAGRHAPGDRMLRYVIGGLARRHDWLNAHGGAIALAGSLLKRGRPQDARAVLADARDYATRTGQDAAVIEIAILTGVAWTDLARLDDAEGVLQAALAASRSSVAPIRLEQARLALARCLFWRGRYADAATLLASMERPAKEPATAVALAAASSRIAIGRRDFGSAVASANEALEFAERAGEPALLARAAGAAAFAHLAIGDRVGVDRDVDRAIRAARAARDPLSALRARLLAAESARRAGRGAIAKALLGRIGKVSTSSLPPIVRARFALLADLLAAPSLPEVVKRHVAATRLEALALFAPETAGHPGSHLQGAVEDVVEILRSCQTADDDGAVLADVCARLRLRLHAAVVGVFGRERGGLVLLASDGSARLDPRLGDRVVAAGQLITPHLREEVIEGGTPVRYGGDAVGALVGRWAFGSPPDVARASVLLTMAATAAGPALAAAIARRAETTAQGAGELLGVSGAMVEIRQAVDRAAAAPFAVLIEGESGSGKELVARALHRRSPRRGRPFCTLNCAALPDDLVEAELFGHARGAFTGAVAERPGVFEEAHTGTLVLDEIGELSLRAQAKVLRTIQEGELRRLGENVARRIDVRIVSATNRDLREEVAAGRFRLDLLYRLDVIRISLPPLRARREDIAALVDHCWREATARVGSRAVLSSATIAALARYDWPGNVRELQNVLAALVVRSPKRGVVPPTALPSPFAASPAEVSFRLDEARRTFEERFVRAALVRSGGHRIRAAEELGVTRQGLTKLMTRLRISESSDPRSAPDG